MDVTGQRADAACPSAVGSTQAGGRDAGPSDPGAPDGTGREDGGTKEIKRLDRVIIRFAGDSGDGMQLTGDRFTSETASFGNDLSTLPNFPAEIRAPAGHAARGLGLPAALRRPRHPDAGRRARRPGRDEPGGAEGEPRRPAARRRRSSSTPTSSPRATWPRSATPPTRSRTARSTRTTCTRSPLTSLTVEALKGIGADQEGGRARRRTCSRSGLLSWLYNRPTEGTERVPARRSSPSKPDIAEANIAAFRAGWNFGETTEDFAVSYEVKPATACRPGTYRNITGNLALSYGLVAASQPVRAAALPRLLPDHAGLGHPARAEQAQALRRPHLPGRGRDRRHRRRARRGVRRRARRDHDLRPGRRAEVRDDRPGGVARAAAARRRRPARRPVDRPADQDRAVRPAAGDVRPQRRGAGADRRAALAGRLLRRRARGRPGSR